MRRTILLSSIFVSLAVPALAVAAFTTASDVLDALQFKNRPVDLSLEAHATYEDIHAALWMKGSMEGEDLMSQKMTMRMTADVAYPEGSARARMQMRVVDQTMYVLVESIEGSSSDELSSLAGSIENQQWYSLSLSELKEQQQETYGLSDEDSEEFAKMIVNALFSVQRNADGSYSVRLKRSAAADLARLAPEIAANHPELGIPTTITSRDRAELRKLLSKFNVHIKGTFDRSDQPTAMKFYMAYTDRPVSAVFQGSIALRSTPVSVSKPANAINLEDTFELPEDSSAGTSVTH